MHMNIISAHSPEGLDVRTQMSKWEASDTLKSFCSHYSLPLCSEPPLTWVLQRCLCCECVPVACVKGKVQRKSGSSCEGQFPQFMSENSSRKWSTEVCYLNPPVSHLVTEEAFGWEVKGRQETQARPVAYVHYYWRYDDLHEWEPSQMDLVDLQFDSRRLPACSAGLGSASHGQASPWQCPSDPTVQN